MMFAQRRNRLTTHFSERILVVQRRISVPVYDAQHSTRVKISKSWLFIVRNVRNTQIYCVGRTQRLS